MGKFPEVLNFNRLFLKLDRSICNQRVGSPRSLLQQIHWPWPTKLETLSLIHPAISGTIRQHLVSISCEKWWV